jgi:galactose mutarotase-like enzyme
MHVIENHNLTITINPAGAELSSIVNKVNGLEYLWSGDPNFWAKKSPVLFPIVGTLKDNAYFYNDKKYELGRHGFAREMNFIVTEKDLTSLTLTLHDDESTVKVFPFHFSFSIKYAIRENELFVTYSILNKGQEIMYFSVGGHPAFKVPVSLDLKYEDYYLLFKKMETAGRWPISKEGLIESASTPLLNNTNRLPLTKELFYKDAIVFKHLQSDEVELKSDKDAAGLSFSFKDFPFLGIWAAKNADFICIEPWCGIADSVDSTQDLKAKEGIIALDAGNIFERTWSVSIY